MAAIPIPRVVEHVSSGYPCWGQLIPFDVVIMKSGTHCWSGILTGVPRRLRTEPACMRASRAMVVAIDASYQVLTIRATEWYV